MKFYVIYDEDNREVYPKGFRTKQEAREAVRSILNGCGLTEDDPEFYVYPVEVSEK